MAPGGGGVANVGNEPVVEQRRFDEDAPGKHGCRGPADRRGRLAGLAADARGVSAGRCVVRESDEFDRSLEPAANRGEKPAASGGEVAGLAAANEPGQVPGGQFLPDVPAGVEGEEVGGRFQFFDEIATDVEVVDAGLVSGMVGQRRVGVADQDRDLLDAADVGELREGNRQRRAPVGVPKEARRGWAGAAERSSAWEAGTGCSWELWSLPGDAAVIVSAQARHSGSFTHQVSAGAIMSTRSLMTRFRNVIGSRSSPRQGSAITVISAPCPFWVWLPGVIETGIRTRLS